MSKELEERVKVLEDLLMEQATLQRKLAEKMTNDDIKIAKEVSRRDSSIIETMEMIVNNLDIINRKVFPDEVSKRDREESKEGL